MAAAYRTVQYSTSILYEITSTVAEQCAASAPSSGAPLHKSSNTLLYSIRITVLVLYCTGTVQTNILVKKQDKAAG